MLYSIQNNSGSVQQEGGFSIADGETVIVYNSRTHLNLSGDIIGFISRTCSEPIPGIVFSDSRVGVLDNDFSTSSHLTRSVNAWANSRGGGSVQNTDEQVEVDKKLLVRGLLQVESVGRRNPMAFTVDGATFSFPGELRLFASDAPPDGWLLCDGSEVSREVYHELFAVVGESFGPGDSSTTFNLPNMHGRYPVGLVHRSDVVGSIKSLGVSTDNVFYSDGPGNVEAVVFNYIIRY